MRTKQEDSAIDSLLGFSNRYTGPNANRVAPDPHASTEKIHEDLVYQKLMVRAPATQASFKGVCRRFVKWCETDTLNADVYKFLAHPATKVAAFLESERQRHVYQGTKPGLNAANAFTEMDKLSVIQGCPEFSSAELTHMRAAVARAENDSMQTERNADPDRHKAQNKHNRQGRLHRTHKACNG